MLKKLFVRAGVPVAFGAASFSALAEAPVLTSLTSAVDFSTTNTAVLGVAASLIVVYITWKAAKLVIGAVRGG